MMQLNLGDGEWIPATDFRDMSGQEVRTQPPPGDAEWPILEDMKIDADMSGTIQVSGDARGRLQTVRGFMEIEGERLEVEFQIPERYVWKMTLPVWFFWKARGPIRKRNLIKAFRICKYKVLLKTREVEYSVRSPIYGHLSPVAGVDLPADGADVSVLGGAAADD